MTSPQSSFCTQMNSSSQKTSAVPLVNMWTSRLLQNSPALHVWLHADCLFALKHHQSVDSVTGICFCILRPSACGETIEKRHLQTGPLMLIDSYHCFCLQLFSFTSLLLLVLIISCNFSFPSFFVFPPFSFLSISPCSFPVFCDPYHPALLLPCAGIAGLEKWISPSCSNAGMEKYRGRERWC